MKTAHRAAWTATRLPFGLAIALLGLLAVEASRSAVASTPHPRNSHDVAMVGEGPVPALFSAQQLGPGQTMTSCIAVDSTTHDVPGDLRLYSGAITDPDGLASFLDITIEEGTGGSVGSCDGFVAFHTIVVETLATFAAAHTDYATGVGDCLHSDHRSMGYRISIALDKDAPNSRQGQTVSNLAFYWEAQP